MTAPDREKWEAIYTTQAPAEARAAAVLLEFTHLLPASGRALDLACGRGGNALHLARHGLTVEAWDITQAALDLLNAQAVQTGLTLRTELRDVVAAPPPPASFDVISVSRFLDRKLVPQLCTALRPGGLIFYQTFVREAVSAEGPSNPEYRLGPNELLELFASLRVLAYREEGRSGDLSRGLRDEAWLVAAKLAPAR